jgi:hypothetical protein
VRQGTALGRLPRRIRLGPLPRERANAHSDRLCERRRRQAALLRLSHQPSPPPPTRFRQSRALARMVRPDHACRQRVPRGVDFRTLATHDAAAMLCECSARPLLRAPPP